MTVKERNESSVDYDDSTLNYYCDYFGEPFSANERKEAIKDLSSLFEGIASIDTSRGIIKFFSKEDIKTTLDKYYWDTVRDLTSTTETGWLRFFHLRELGAHYKQDYTIFIVDGCTMTSMQFFEDCYHHADKDLFIGQIFDAHC